MLSNYSFIDDTLAGSDKPTHMDDIDRYLSDGITHIISLTPTPPLVSKYLDGKGITLHHLPVYATPDQEQLDTFEKLMSDIKNGNQKAVVHCQYGQERTGIFIAVYLVRNKGMSVNQAIAYIREQRPSSLQTAHANSFVRNNL